MRKLIPALLACLLPGLAASRPHNVILFVPDALRAAVVTPDTAPAMAGVRDGGVDFRNSHSLFPTFTTANASAFATGHQLGDTGDFSNTIFTGVPIAAAGDSVTPFLESDPVLEQMNQHFGGNYLNEESVMAAARRKGLQTAVIGKLGPARVQDLTASPGTDTLLVDDRTGAGDGLPLGRWSGDFTRAGVPTRAPARSGHPGDNGDAGTFDRPGTLRANTEQQDWFVQVATRVALPRFKHDGRPFFMVFWSRDPDGTQHDEGDSLGALVPGVNGPTSKAAIRNADNDLAALRAALKKLGLARTTDIVIAADHGVSTIARTSATSDAAGARYEDVAPGQLPAGFLAIDLARALASDHPDFRLFDALDHDALVDLGSPHPRRQLKQGSGLIGADPSKPEVVVAANGGSDLIYLPGAAARTLAPAIVAALLRQDYVSGIFVADPLGPIAGTLPLSAINLEGSAVTPHPAMVVNFRSWDTGCGLPERCAVEVADSVLQQGQGMHGGFSRADTWNFMAAAGPDFRRRFRDPLPASNADVARTIGHLLQLDPPSKGRLRGRVLEEALAAHHAPPHAPLKAQAHVTRSTPAASGLSTVLRWQSVGDARYLDAAGFPGRTVGLDAR